MKVTVRKDRNLIIVNARNTQNENDVETIEITVPEEYEDFNKKIAFITDDGVVWDFIEDNKYTLTNAITKYKKVKFYIWLTQDNKDFRSEERTIVFNKNQDANEEVTEEEISGFNKMINILEKEITEVTGLQEDLTNLINTVQTKLDNGDFKGDKGDKGDPGESYDDTEIKEEISDIKEEQTTQNTRIEELEEQVQELESNQLTGTSTGQSIYIEDSTNTKVRDIGLSGNSEQESTTGKQLFNESQLLEATGWTENNGVYSGTIDSWFSKFKNGFTGLSFETNTQYTISLKGYTTGGTPRIKIVYTDNTSSTLAISASSMTEYSITSTSGKTISSVKADFGSGSAQTLSLSEVQIEKGTSKTSWEKYTGGQASPNPSYPQEIHSTGDSGSVNEKVQNKNLWNSELEKAEYDTSGNKTTTNVWVVNIQKITVEPNTHYIVSQKERPSQYRIIFFENDTFISRSDNTQNTTTGYTSYTFNTPENCNKIYIQFRSTLEVIAKGSYNMTPTDITDVQLEQGSTATPYQTHEEQNISFPLAQGQKLMQGDYLADDGVHHVRGEVVLDGTEDYISFTTQTNSNYVFLLREGIKQNANGLSNYFIRKNYYTEDKVGIWFTPYSTSLIQINFPTSISTLADWKTWLSTHNVKVQYELAEEVIDPYTEEQQAVWEQIKALRTYKPVTHISSTDEVPATVDVTYVKDLETVINNLGGA